MRARHPTPAELHRLFQARMWREYAMAWDGRKTMTGVGRAWVENILRVPRAARPLHSPERAASDERVVRLEDAED